MTGCVGLSKSEFNRCFVTSDFLFYCVKKLEFTSARYWVFASLRVTECHFASPCFFARDSDSWAIFIFIFTVLVFTFSLEFS